MQSRAEATPPWERQRPNQVRDPGRPTVGGPTHRIRGAWLCSRGRQGPGHLVCSFQFCRHVRTQRLPDAGVLRAQRQEPAPHEWRLQGSVQADGEAHVVLCQSWCHPSAQEAPMHMSRQMSACAHVYKHVEVHTCVCIHVFTTSYVCMDVNTVECVQSRLRVHTYLQQDKYALGYTCMHTYARDNKYTIGRGCVYSHVHMRQVKYAGGCVCTYMYLRHNTHACI